MRLTSLLCGVSACFAVCSAAVAGAPETPTQVSAYLSAGFGGNGIQSRVMADSLRYGLRIDYASARGDVPAPSVLALDLNRHGLIAARLGGVDLARAYLIAREAGEAAGEKGWGGQIGDAFSGIGLGLGTVLVAGGIGVAIIVASSGGDDNNPLTIDGSHDCNNNIDVVGPCNPVLGDTRPQPFR